MTMVKNQIKFNNSNIISTQVEYDSPLKEVCVCVYIL